MSAFDLSGRITMKTSHNRLSSRRADTQALRSDWEAVGKDMQTAIGKKWTQNEEVITRKQFNYND
jgi:hypothetical protein